MRSMTRRERPIVCPTRPAPDAVSGSTMVALGPLGKHVGQGGEQAIRVIQRQPAGFR